MNRKLTLGMLAVSTALSAPLAAQDTAAAESTTGVFAEDIVLAEDIIVFARHRDERLVDAPVAITAVTGQQLEQLAVNDFTDIAQLVPSMVAGRAASGSAASIFLRGVGSTALSAGFDQSVSFVVDGLPMSRGREIGLTQYDVQSIEVLKGPQALFFGRNTTGGLISVNTRNPGDEFETGLRAGYGFEAQDKYIEGFVSGPLGETFGARLAFRFADSEGAFTNSASETSFDVLGRPQFRNSKYRGGSRTESGRLTLEWTPTEAASFQVKAGYTRQRDGGPTDIVERVCGGGRTIPASSNAIPPSPNSDCTVNGISDLVTVPEEVADANYRYAGDGRLYADLKSGFGILTAGFSAGLFDVTSITAFYKFKQTDLNNVAGESYPATFSQLADFEQFTQELRFQSKFNGPLNILAGAFFSDSSFVFNTDAYIFPLPIDPGTGTAVTFKRDNGFDGDSMSLFGELTYDINEQFELSAGARWTTEARNSFQRSLPAHSAFGGVFPGGIELRDRFRDDNISPQVTVRYKPSNDMTLYASYKQGFKSGGFNISQTITPAASVEAGQFGSETAEGFEAGFRTIQADGRLRFNFTAYHYIYSDLQVQTFDPVTVGQVVGNAGELRVRGLEGDFNWDIGNGLSFRGAAAFNDAEYRDFVGQCFGGQTIAEGCDQLPNANTGVFNGQDFSGRTPPKAPRFGGRLGATYETEVGGDLRLMFGGDVSYTSRYNFTDTLRPDGYQDAFAKIDASVRLLGRDDRWSLAFIGRNLTNELVVAAGNDIPFTGGVGTGTTSGVLSDMSVFVDNPREFLLEVGIRF